MQMFRLVGCATGLSVRRNGPSTESGGQRVL